MRSTIWIWYILLLGSAVAELQCEWEYKDKAYLGGWAIGITRAQKYPTLEEAQKVCKTLGDNCGGVTFWGGGYTCRSNKVFTAHGSEQSWRKTCMGVPLFRVGSITPTKGSRVGGSRVTISGQGFSTNQFGYDDPSLGNKVTFYHKDETYPAVQCHVQTYYTSSTRIVCDLAKPDVYWKDYLEYRMRISVDGTWMDSTGTNIYCGGACTYYFHKDNSPYISSITTRHVAAGSVLTMTGRMWTDNFEPSNEVSSGSDYIKRVYLNAFTCDTSDDSGNSYGTDLVKDGNGDDTSTGSLMCKSESPGATSYRPSFLHSKWGRSEVRNNVNRVDAYMQKYAFQTYNVLKSVSPSEGSTSGGTKITITSEHVVGPVSNIAAEVGGDDCKVESFTSDQIVCSTPAKQDKTVYPGNRGVTVEYWAKESNKSTSDARGLDVDLIREFKQDADNFLFEKLHMDSRPDSLKTITGDNTDEPYYVRAKFFLNIQETDMYGFHMISDHSGKLYVSTDDDPANAVLLAECTNAQNNWNTRQTDVNITLEAGKIYYVEFVGVMWNFGQDFGVGMTKKNTPYQTYDVDISKKEYPYWYWKQTYSDEIQVINLGELITKPETGFKLKIGERETSELYASSTAAQISAAIIDTAVYKCPTLDSADSWYSVDFENGDMSYTGGWARNYIEPYCGRWVAVNSWAIFHVKYEKQVYEWDLSKGYKHLCFGLMTKQPRVTLYYELDYEDSNFNWKRQGFWRGSSQEETPELQDNDGTWKYNCIDFEKRVKEIDADLWDSRIGNRKWKVRRVELGWEQENGLKRNRGACKKWMETMQDGACIYIDAIRILRSDVTGTRSGRTKRLVREEIARVKGFALDGQGLLEAATVKVTDYCADGADCTTERTDEATERKWEIKMKTYECAYNFPLIGIAGKSETVVKKDTESTYTVGGKTVNILREAAITPDLQGTFDVTIDGTTHTNIDVQIHPQAFLDIINRNGDYSQAHKWGSCYERHWRLERKYSGHHGWHSVDSTNVVGVGEVQTFVIFKDNERGGLVMTPLYGDWLRTANSKPQVSVKVNGVSAFCNGTCDYTTSDANTPTVASLTPTSGARGASVTITGTGFGTTNSAVTVTLGGAAQTVSQVTDTAVTITLTDGVAKPHPAADIVVNVAGKGNAKVADSVAFTYSGSVSGITPASGGIGGGTLVTISGSGFDPEYAGVTFSGTTGRLESATYTQIKVFAPAGTEGAATIAITGGTGFVAPDSASLAYSYTTTNVPTVSQISPVSGSVVGNTKMTITGTNLGDIKEAKIGDVACAKDADETSTETKYYCIAGGNSPGKHLVSLETNAGEFAQSVVEFNYILMIQHVSPLQGSVMGGTEVTITGNGFGTDKDMLNVEFGEFECKVKSVTDTEIMCDTEPAMNVDQLWSDYTGSPSCVESKPTGYVKTAQDVHNMYRRRHSSTPDICFSDSVAKSAASWADHLAQNNVFKSSSTSNRENRGENLMIFEHWDLKSDEAYMRDAISAWYAEGSNFNPEDPSNTMRYAQMLWKLSDQVGCAITKKRASSTEKYKIYIVCHYAPAGNTEGKFGDYVKQFDTEHHRATSALFSESAAVNVYLDSRKATVTKSAPSSAPDCAPLSGTVSGCSDSNPAAAQGDFSFSYYSCSTPKITNVTRQVLWDETITIDGKGFGTSTCAVTVKLGSDHSCTVTSVNDKRIKCKVDLATEPPVYTLFEAKVNILGRGDAVFSGENHNLYAYSSIQPKITSISPTQGSLEGGLPVTLTGGGFKYNTGVNPISGSVTDGSSDFEVLSATYTAITVRSRTGISETVDTPKTITLTQDSVEVECSACTFTYKSSRTPTVTNVTKTAKDPGPGYTVTITGSNLCPSGTGTTISIGSNSCVTSSENCQSSKVVCDVGDLPAGTYNVIITTTYGYPSYDEGMNRLVFVYAIKTVVPTSGSVYGGTLVTITGTGLPASESLTVTTSKYHLTVISKTTTEIIARTPDRKVTAEQNTQIRFNNVHMGTYYKYTSSLSPVISGLTPATGTYNTEITIAGERFLNAASDATKTSVVIDGDKTCVISSVTLTEIKCKLPHAVAKEMNVVVTVDPYGSSNVDQKIVYTMVLGATDPASPTTGSLGGPSIVLQGSGFPHGAEDTSLNVTVCGVETTAELVSNSQLNIPLPACPDDVCSTASHSCDIVVQRYDTVLTKTGAVTYNKADTPTVTNIDPSDAGTGGGKTITITGTGFSDATSDVSVKFDGVTCTLLSTSTTQITCKTGAKADKANKDGVEVRINKSLALNPGKETMTYMDKWSSKFTWGGDEKNKPVEGDLAVLTEGQIIYLDESPPKLRALLLRGGHLVFDDNQDLILKSDYILILGGGSITIGTEDSPFQHEAIIEMHGNQQSTELPMYGAKTLAVRNGTVEMHGKEVSPKWTELGETAEAGTTSIIINTETNWKVSDQIALSSSSFAPEENEEFIITTITYDKAAGKTTLGLNQALKFKHISLEQTINGVKIKTAAKIGHLTRNVKMRGNVNEDHLEMVDACPQTFDPDQFATQTCFQGRYGAMMDSDQFGSQIMFHAAAMETREVHGRLENAEFSWAGQAFRLGRYPIHFHMNGDVSGSYVKGCAVHHTFNRAVTVHGVNNLLVKDNVAFNNMGHAFFLEDGVEEDNVFDGNLAIFTQSSSSLLNVDVTPASFWIVNPRNTFINNVAAGSTHFGFWFNMPAHPAGPSATNTVCPRNMGMKEFRGNEAHSCGRYGIWVWEFWNPRGDGSCEATTPNMTTLHDFHGWHNLRGVEIETGSGIAMDNFLLHDNWFSQMEVHKCIDATFEEGNTRMTNSQIISKTQSSDGLKMLYMNAEFECGSGVVLPGKGMMSVHDSTMHEFTKCPVWEACGGCKPRQGGFPSEFKGISYINSPVKGKFKWEFEIMMRDLDGSLSETGKKNSIVTPNMDILDKSSCAKTDSWSHGSVEGAVCDDKTSLVRLAWNQPSISELLFKSVFLTNTHGSVSVPWFFKRLTHKQGWMATVPTANSYTMKWDTDLKFTNASFKMTAYYPKDGDYIVLEQSLNDKPDYITVGGSSNKKLEAIDGAVDDPGTFTFDDETKKLSHLITGKGVDTTQDLKMDLKVYKCFYENCTDPHPKPLPTNPTVLQRPETPKRWSVSSDWMGTEEGLGGFNGILPKVGDNVIIPSSWWMVYDASMEGLGDIMVYGVLEFSNEVDTVLGANRIVVVGGKLVVGWGDDPLKVKAHIKLTGSRDDKEYTLNDGTTVGSKALGIVGFTEMHAVVPDVLSTTLTVKAPVGATTITVKDNVMDKWKIGDEIAIASTSFIPEQAEKRTITKVEGHMLTLDTALEFEHDYMLETIHEHVYERTAEVGLLTRLITIEGVMDPADTSLYGGRVLVSDYSQVNEAGEREEFIPVAQIMGVQFKNCGQRGYRDYWDPRYALAIQNTKPSEDSYVKSCSIDVSHNHAIGILGSHNVEVSGNVIYHSRGSGILTNSENTKIVGNTVIYMRSYGNWETPVEKR
ncbi:fibrocystin-L-like isoform X2 [Bolinopsis microptera]|uniref:fibrocystin-L-like isoform X2 n=1 Tax=Bolinopsis microptera TaxID=2820187 RepID=UPI00307A0435